MNPEDVETPEVEPPMARAQVEVEEVAPQIETSSERKSIVEVAKEVNNNNRGWGARESTQRKRLAEAGYNPTRVLNEAHRQANPDGHIRSLDALADEVISGEWGEGYDRNTRLENAGYSPRAVLAEVARRNFSASL